jgi:hypothetical protein
MNQKDKEAWFDFKATVTSKLNQKQFKLLCDLHAKYYKHRYYEPCSCRPKEIRMWIADIDRLYDK